MPSDATTEEDELLRYVTYWQAQMQTPGTEPWFDASAHFEWLETRGRDALEKLAVIHGREAVDEYRSVVGAFRPQTPFDSVHSQEIFAPILSEIAALATEGGMRVESPVHLHDSTDLAPSPMSLPSAERHLILAGKGTFAFCNYWGKVIARLADRLASDRHGRAKEPATTSDVLMSLRADAGLLALACRLATYYAFTGTLLGFGVVEQEARLVAFRAEYVHAMEVFIIAHEYAHCFIEERDATFRGPQPVERMHQLERSCDFLACALTQAYGGRRSLWAAYTNAGAVLCFWALELGERARTTLGGPPPTDSPSHPSLSERLQAVREQTLRITPAEHVDAVDSYLRDLMLICDALAGAVLEALGAVRSKIDSARAP